MTTNSQLLNALLAMDVYHRGVSGGLLGLVPETQIDDTIRGAPSPIEYSAIGFFAQSYTLKDLITLTDQVIIVYRGTDDGAERGTVTLDVRYGYPLAVGGFLAPQAVAAVAFYRSFLTDRSLADPNITGHSLGGCVTAQRLPH